MLSAITGPPSTAAPEAEIVVLQRRPKLRFKKTRVALAVLGVLLLAGAGVTRFVVLPGAAKLPSNSNTTNVYAGTAPVLLNTAALTPGSTAPLLLQNVPLQVTESVKVLRSNGSDAVVDYRTVQKAGGMTLPVLDHKYQVNRSNLGPGTSISMPGLVATKGLTISFPIGTEQKGYTGWVMSTGRTTPLRFAGTASSVTLNGKTYDFGFTADVFKQTTPAKPITDPQELAMFPTSIPKSQLAAIAAGLHLPASMTNALALVMPKLPDMVPLAYTYASTYTYWVAPTDGLVVDLQANETRAVGLPASVLGTAVPIANVAQFVFTDTPATLLARLADARHDAWALGLVGTTLPLTGLAVGVVLIAIAAVLRIRRPDERRAAVERMPLEGMPEMPPARRQAA